MTPILKFCTFALTAFKYTRAKFLNHMQHLTGNQHVLFRNKEFIFLSVLPCVSWDKDGREAVQSEARLCNGGQGPAAARSPQGGRAAAAVWGPAVL